MIVSVARLAAAIVTMALLFTAPVFASDACDSLGEDDRPTEACVNLMKAALEPAVQQAPLDTFTLSHYSFWRVGPDPIPLYSGPGGDVIGEIPYGFNFVRAIDTSHDDWLQIEGGQWISRADAQYAQASRFSGVLLPNGIERPFAWVLDTFGLFTSDYPGGPQSDENGRLLMRYDLVNIFGEVEVDGWTWYMVGPDQWINQRFVSVVKPVERPPEVSGNWVAIDLFEQTLVAYEDDTPVFATLVSTGAPPWDTNEGVFRVWARVEADGMSGAAGAPDAYALQSIPWVQYFDGSISLHGTYWHDLFGYRHSHGCVNLTISDARFVYDFLGRNEPNDDGEIEPFVYVYSSGEYRTDRP